MVILPAHPRLRSTLPPDTMTDAPAAPPPDRRAWLVLAGAAIGALAFPSRRLRAQAREVIKVGSTLALPPFQFVDEAGEIRGFEIDLLRAIAGRLGIDLEFVKTPFAQAFVGLAAGKYRLNASNIYIRCERIGGPGRVGAFSVPTFDVSLSISTRAEHAARATALERLAGLDVGVESRGTGADLLADRFKETLGFRKVVFDSTAALFLALEQGRIDAAIQSDAVARYVALRRRGVVVGPPLPGTAVPVGLLFRAGDPLRLRFNAAIDALKREGVTQRLYERWFGGHPPAQSAVVTVVPEITAETCGPRLPGRPAPAPPAKE
jgi:ABC-type amino acid transport substrate-binding protein